MEATPFAIREELLTLLQGNLLGPADGPEEELPASELRVTERYLVGGLAPGGKMPQVDGSKLTEPDEEPDLAPQGMVIAGADSQDAPEEKEPVLVDSLLPSSAGFSFTVDNTERAIAVHTAWGRYERANAEHEGGGLIWKRIPVDNPPLQLDLREGENVFRPAADSDIRLHWRIRHRNGLWHVTLFLVNTQPKKRKLEDENWIFQVNMSVDSADGGQRPIFVQQQEAATDRRLLDPNEQREMDALALRYRHCRVFARGHGCAVRAERTAAAPADRACRLHMDFLPVAYVPGQTSRDAEDDPLLQHIALDMRELAAMSQDALLANLARMADAYAAWVNTLASSVAERAFQVSAQQAQKAAAHALTRIREGIALLGRDAHALKAFQFANNAMHWQRVHSIFANKVRATGQLEAQERAKLLHKLDTPGNRSWRLFQLIFLLLNIPSISDPLHQDRSGEGHDAVADLLWFSTGGGKTEAYLGLTAYTLALRRLQDGLGGLDSQHGVGVFMRYTLRLLTLQQFQRAAALICACEELRKKDTATWGVEPFRLGLWVGSKSTPNSLENASRQLDKTQGTPYAGNGSPVQFRTCPWCGAPITENQVKVYKGTTFSNRCLTYCGDPDGLCPFSRAKAPEEGLPVMVVDEEIYRRPPSLLISTVDKFAQMPWKGEVEMLFGRVTGLCPRHGFVSPDVDEAVGATHIKHGNAPAVSIKAHQWLRPPDLIIQDELHLINGPLGSMVALYENAVDCLCEWTLNGKTVRPKVIASTATIRRADEQIRKIFHRRVDVFPPPGVDSRDNFFSRERSISPSCPGRVYMGICPIGHRMPPTTVRMYATVMAAAQKLLEIYGALADPWMTTVGYFNSIRELAGTRRLVEDEVRGRLADREQRGLARRRLSRVEELTSRQASKNIPDILEKLGNAFVAPSEEVPDKKYPYDVVLATNMISVGVDIERLGLMLLLGQPKTTSEYIQASSRVGRAVRSPGLVITTYNWARPRDLSHFEDFYDYHAAFQRHVEALSVTPFASRALDRGLAGVLVALVRLMGCEMNGNITARDLPEHEALFQDACARLIQRAEAISQDTETAERIQTMLAKLRDEWLTKVHLAKATGLAYTPTAVAAGLLAASDKPQEAFACPNSLRDVESTVKLFLDTNPTGLTVEEE